jgi:D-serine deaminase-like pyridoxal phosphate-dependent protein
MRQALGRSVRTVETPACIVDLAACERNNISMDNFCKSHGVLWRAHAKAHKSSVLALRQIQAGSNGVCVQKTGEVGPREFFTHHQ